MAIDFFAMPDEQRKWFWRLLSEDQLMCVYCRHSAPVWTEGIIDSQESLASLDFNVEGEFGIQFFLGKKEFIGSDYTPERFLREARDDFTRLQAIRITASCIVDNRMLLDGQIAIMSPSYYRELGIDPNPVQAWYKRVKSAFHELVKSKYLVTMKTTSGKIEVVRGMLVSPGAVEWRLSGKLLKQFPKGPVEFDVKRKEGK